jgi:D-alanine-D-alanine ligase
MLIGMTYDLRDDYLREGYSELETAEFDRPDTIDTIADVLERQGHQVDRIGNIKHLAARLVAGDRWDLVFNICEGMHGLAREAQVPALLDAWSIPYTFSDGLVCALTLHKGMTKRVVMSRGIASPAFAEVNCAADISKIKLPFPLFAKPVAEGTSKGITPASRISRRDQLKSTCLHLLETYQQPVLVETFLPGREFTTGILGTGERARPLATMEVILRGSADEQVYTYRNKEHCEELVTYRLLRERRLARRVEAVALAAWRSLGCRDGGRVDVRLDADGNPHFLEVNPLAGMHYAHSDLPIMASLAGMSFDSLIGEIIDSAAQRVKQAPVSRRKQAHATGLHA